MRLRWTVPAAEDLENIKAYLDTHYPQFAEPTVRTIYQRVRSWKTAPNRGRPVRELWACSPPTTRLLLDLR